VPAIISQTAPIPPLNIKIPTPLEHLKSSTPVSSSSTSRPSVIVPRCAEGQSPERLATGNRIEQDEGASGESKFVVKNGLNVDAVVRLAEVSTKRTIRFVYVQAHDQYSITGIEPGTFTIRFMQGKDWIANCRSFLHDLEVQKFRETCEFGVTTQENEYGVKTTVKDCEVSLNPVPFGNARTEAINVKEFFDGDQHVTVAQ
jgi:hypothetical protein